MVMTDGATGAGTVAKGAGQSRWKNSSSRRWKPVAGSVSGSMSEAISACQRSLTGRGGHRCPERREVVDLEIGEQDVAVDEDRVVTCPRGPQRVEHLRPDRRVPPAVLALLARQQAHGEPDTFHGHSF